MKISLSLFKALLTLLLLAGCSNDAVLNKARGLSQAQLAAIYECISAAAAERPGRGFNLRGSRVPAELAPLDTDGVEIMGSMARIYLGGPPQDGAYLFVYGLGMSPAEASIELVPDSDGPHEVLWRKAH